MGTSTELTKYLSSLWAFQKETIKWYFGFFKFIFCLPWVGLAQTHGAFRWHTVGVIWKYNNNSSLPTALYLKNIFIFFYFPSSPITFKLCKQSPFYRHENSEREVTTEEQRLEFCGGALLDYNCTALFSIYRAFQSWNVKGKRGNVTAVR